MTVAKAADHTPIPIAPTKSRSSAIFVKEEIMRKNSGCLLSPKACRIPTKKLYMTKAREPAK